MLMQCRRLQGLARQIATTPRRACSGLGWLRSAPRLRRFAGQAYATRLRSLS
jgi:hypothetical protein